MNSPTHSTALVIGGGTMGSDVALVFAQAGCRTIVLEPSAERRATITAHFKRGLAEPLVSQRVDCPLLCSVMDEIDWASIDLVVECIPEQLQLKQALFAALERRARPDTLITSNSSSLPISAIAKELESPTRMFGLHFFMPAHLVPLVEVVIGERSDVESATDLAEFMCHCGKVPVIVKKDLPGFLANRLQHALAREAFALIDAKVASPEDVDAAVRFGFGFRYLAAGPVLQRDHAGLDVHCAAAGTIYPSLSAASKPSAALSERVAARKLGMKSGEGFFQWTAESIAAERTRYDGLLCAGLAILAPELPPCRRTSATAIPLPRANALGAHTTHGPEPLIVTVAPTGARKTKADHPAIPLTPDAIGKTARTCLDAGAAMLHLHVRGPDELHSLDADAYRVATEAVRRAVGDHMVVQITTEGASRYSPIQQMSVVKEVHPEAVSLAIRELSIGTMDEGTLAGFFSWLVEERVMTQVILYDVDDIRTWRDLQRRGVVPQAQWFVLYVLGRYIPGQTSSPQDLLPFLAADDGAHAWAVCAFGPHEHACAIAAAALGGHVRVGFENNVYLRDGSIAPDNAMLVAQVAEGAAVLGRKLATADDIRNRFHGDRI